MPMWNGLRKHCKTKLVDNKTYKFDSMDEFKTLLSVELSERLLKFLCIGCGVLYGIGYTATDDFS
jgi:hypothetical protein